MSLTLKTLCIQRTGQMCYFCPEKWKPSCIFFHFSFAHLWVLTISETFKVCFTHCQLNTDASSAWWAANETKVTLYLPAHGSPLSLLSVHGSPCSPLMLVMEDNTKHPSCQFTSQLQNYHNILYQVGVHYSTVTFFICNDCLDLL